MPEIDVRHFAANAAEESVSSFTVGVVSDRNGRPGSGIGTGVAVEWRGQSMFLTAAHVVEGTPEERIWFFFLPEGNLQREYIEDKTAGKRFIRRRQVDVREVRILDPKDVAVICLSGDLRGEHNVRFFPLDEQCRRRTPPVGRTHMVIGFPSAISEQVLPGKHAASRAITYEKLVDPPSSVNFDPTDQLALTYSYGEDIPPSGVDPHGFSGAGVWYESHQDRPIWHPQPRLAGIITTYYPRKRILTGIRIEAITNLLEENFG